MIFCLAVAATWFFIYAASLGGRLSYGVPLYDDVSYFVDALERQVILDNQGLFALASHHFRSPPHSAWASYLALSGFTIFGVNWWAPYAMNSIVLFVALLIVDSLARTCAWWVRVGLAVLFLSLPVASLIIVDFRPDAFCALLTAAGIVRLAMARLHEMVRRQVLVVGLFWGAALCIKPTLFAQTSLFFVGAMVLSGLHDWWSLRQFPKRAFWNAMICIVTATILSFPILGIQLPEYIRYMSQHIFGQSRQLWALKGSFQDHLLYYTFSFASDYTIGSSMRIFFILLLSLGVAWWKGQTKLFQLLAWLAVFAGMCWLPPTLNEVKSAYFGLAFVFLVLFAMIRALAAWLNNEYKLYRPLSIAVGCCLFGLVFSRSDFLRSRSYQTPQPGDVSQVMRAVHEKVRDFVQENPDGIVMLPTVGFLNSDVLTYYCRVEGLVPPKFVSEYQSSDLAKHLGGLESAGLVIIPEKGSQMMGVNMPHYLIHDELFETIDDDERFQLIASILDTTKSHVRIYARQSTERLASK